MSNTALLHHYHEDLTISEDEELEAIRAAFIYEEQRIPTEEEQRDRSCDLTRLGPLLHSFLRRLKESNSRSVFELEQTQWTYLAGEWSRYWRLEDGKQKQPDKPLYAPLDETKREIRVLQVSRLSPMDSNTTTDVNSNETFKANLLHVSLDDNPPYIAISYAWGDPSPVGLFQSDQEGAAEFQYNQAVSDILNALVPEDSSIYLWIDALCINQENNAEKGIQVAMMGEVFRKARQVVVSLAEANVDTTANMDLLHRAGPVMEVDRPFYFNDYHVARFEAESTKAGIPLRAWSSVHSLLSRKWFTRYWVIQELALGTSPVVTCGRHAVSWDLFSTVYNWICRSGAMISRVVDRTLPYKGTSYYTKLLAQPWTNLFYLREISRKGSLPFTFPWMLNVFDCFKAKDPRDRVFAITGLASQTEVEEESFQPNYEISVKELYTQVARHLLVRNNGLTVLYRAGVGFPRSLSLLPSWVPDWTSKRESSYLYMRPTKPRFPGHVKFRVDFVPEPPRVAILHGCIVDSVSRLGPIKDVYFRYRPSLEREEAERHWTDSVLELIASYTPAINFSTACRDAPIGSPGWKYCLWGTLSAGSQQEAFEECVFDRYLKLIGCSARKPWEHPDPEVDYRARGFRASTLGATYGRRFFVSSKGYFGLTSPGTQEGDLVCVFAGMIVPIILRPVDSEGPDFPSTPASYILVGEAYHHGIAEEELELEPDFMGPIRLV